MTNTTKARRLTKRDYFNALIKIAESNLFDFSAVDADIDSAKVLEFAQNEIDLLNKKTSADRKPTAKDVENANIKAILLEVMDNEGATVSDIQKRDERLASLSNQKVLVLIRQLIEEGAVEKFEDKRKSLFRLV